MLQVPIPVPVPLRRVGAWGETGLRTATLVQQLFQMPTSTYRAVICSPYPMS